MGPFLLLTNPLLLPPLLSVDFRMMDKGASLIIPTSPTELSSLHSWELSSREETQLLPGAGQNEPQSKLLEINKDLHCMLFSLKCHGRIQGLPIT